MSFLRATPLVAVAVLVSALLTANVHATDVSMAGGSVNFTTPNSWRAILETQGDPEARVFQVPDPSPTGKNNLARVTVTVQQVGDISGFHQFMAEATAKALALPGYKAAAVAPMPNSNFYTAQENDTAFNYTEHYWFKHGRGVQLRCIRPSHSLAGDSWQSGFDQACQAIANQLN